MGRRKKVTPERVLEEMARIAFASLYDYVEVARWEDDEGTVHCETRPIASDRIPPEKRAGAAAIRQTANGVEVKLFDKWRALEALGRLTGLGSGDAGEAVRVVDDL